MNKKISTFLSSFVLILSVSAQNNLVLEPAAAKETISRFLYGHFAEHLGRCVYDGLYVGEGNKKIPNTNGVRNDIIDALKKLKVPVLRWPGGCFADTYHWKDGIGPKKQRPSIVNHWWGETTEDNSFGTHEFLNFCKQIGAEPYLASNMASGTPQELFDWIQYVNFPGKSPMSDLRRKNGQEMPWNVKFWGVGNESWGCGGNMKPEFYASLYRMYATFTAGWRNDKKLWRVASGSNSADYAWTEGLMKNIPLNMMEGVAMHHYSVLSWGDKGPATTFTEQQYFKTMKEAWRMDTIINRQLSIMDKYDPNHRVALLVDEWGG
jgi:alpha-L-arabinofuranosidase